MPVLVNQQMLCMVHLNQVTATNARQNCVFHVFYLTASSTVKLQAEYSCKITLFEHCLLRAYVQSFEGAVGAPSSRIEFTTNRFSDFNPHKKKVTPDYTGSTRISHGADVETRFHNYKPHKQPPAQGTDYIGITTAQVEQRNPATRFHHEGKHFGQLNPNADGVVAGVSADKQPHEIDRFDTPKQHRGQLNPNADGDVAGVSAAQQPHEIDRFEVSKQHRGQLNPNATGIVAGVTADKQPHEIDRFEGAQLHRSRLESQRQSVHNAPMQPDSRPLTARKQPPGGTSTFVLG
eukprot:m.207960 g.207960  ORF g.207960 m.207960 type:complete len:291 (-) comp18952_c0_seq2:347-1219(-)